jgi:hypothetical protein
MRSFSLVLTCAALIMATACGSSTPESNGEINSQEDVRRLFEAVMPDLVEAFTELASQLSFAVSSPSSTDKQANGTSSVQCPGGGVLNVDLVTGQATLTDCSAGGVTISAQLALFVSPLGPSSYQADFNGILMVSGSFTGTVQVNTALVQWTDPATVENTFWQVTVTVNDQTFTVSSADPGGNGGGNGQEKCADGDFILDPGSETQSTITREVCFHSRSNLGGCDIYNYRIPPSTDFSEFMDIFYGGTGVGCEENMLGEFMENGSNWLLFGTPNGQPPEDVPGSPQLVVTGGSYSVVGQNRNGSFVFYWPTQNMPNL